MKYSLDVNLSKTTQEQQRLCDRFTQVVTTESPEELLRDFQALWIDGSDYPDKQIESDRETLLSYKVDQEDFNLCLYKCCQVIVEEWQKKPETAEAIPKLFDLLTGSSEPDADAYWRSRTALRLNQRLQGFRKSDQAASLHHFLGLLQPTPISLSELEHHPLKSLLYRYPYLYPYSLLGEDKGPLSHSVRRVKSQKTKEFDTNLSQYVIDQVRRPRSVKSAPKSHKKSYSKNNPSFLSDRELNRAFQEYLGKVEGIQSNRELAQNFSIYRSEIQFYADFKQVFY